MTVKELEQAFKLKSAEDFRQLVKTLNQLEEKGEVVRTRTNRYGVPERLNLVRGELQVHAKGFGFVLPSDSDDGDIYIHPRDLNGAMHGDLVIARINKKQRGDKRTEGEIIRIVKRHTTTVVGTFSAVKNFGFVIPDEKRLTTDIYIPQDGIHGAADGDKVVVNIVHYPDKHKGAIGEVTEILGHKDDPGIDILSIIRKYALPEVFPEDVIDEARSVPQAVDPEEFKGRRDLRDQTIITIDGADAKDLDDAVSIEERPNGNTRLGVHIADVSHYVREGTALDREALRRGCSVYLVDRVIPMLPPHLSNGICSLNPREDRLTITCEMEIDRSGKIVAYDLFPSVINTNERMTYDDVRTIIEENDEQLCQRYENLVPDLHRMQQLAKILRNKRMQRGAIDFDFTEAQIIVDDKGKPVDIIPRPRTVAEQIIEEFMLAANETVASHFHWLNLPFIYRIHERPDSEKLQSFLEFITHFGYTVRGKVNDIHPRALQQLLEEVDGEPEENVISRVLLRSMQQARYDTDNKGHYGLSVKNYTHFTAPIRRYPDLIVHRMIRELWQQGNAMPDERAAYWGRELPAIADQSSKQERIAAEAEQETEALKKAEYMADKIGLQYTGVISGVTSFGLFVELENTVEGLVHVSHMVDDYYHFHSDQMMLVGERTGKQYRMGDEVKVRVTHVNLDERTVNFELVEKKARKNRLKNERGTVIHAFAGKTKKNEKPFYEAVAKKKQTRKKKKR